ncbi:MULTISPECIES: DUF1827 family protein [Lacticaseibacillus]|uniref:DUF1827 family protein n=1 Tax=Lacticaseibacillus TaxID=2759736 RepID=UPI00063DB9E5|nr:MULTISPECIES: DUF1827 family protein [Lacticaseibacillus]KLI75927.1 hypothetical protein AAW28_06000 [Lacticaseibacillus casei]
MKLVQNPIRLNASLHKMLPHTMRFLYSRKPVKYFELYTLGSVHVYYVEGFDQIDIVLTHDKRTIKDAEIDFVLEKLLPDTPKTELKIDHAAKSEIEHEVHRKLKVHDVVIVEKASA